MKMFSFCVVAILTLAALPRNGTVQTILAQTQQPQEAFQLNGAEVITRHVIELVRRTARSPDDPLVNIANELLTDAGQSRIRQTLPEKLNRMPGADQADKYNKLIDQLDRDLSPRQQARLRKELRRGGTPVVARWPWPFGKETN